MNTLETIELGSSVTAKVRIFAVLFGILVVLAAGFGIYHWVTVSGLKVEIVNLNRKVDTLTEANGVLRGNVATLSRSLDDQNKAVRALTDEQDKMSQVATAAIEKAKRESRTWKKRYDEVLNAPRPPGDDCAAFNTKLTQYLEVRQQEANP
jgi:cell division protein FtsB